MNLLMLVSLAALFIALTPGILVSFPPGGSKMTVLAVHAVLFTAIWHFTQETLADYEEGFYGPKTKKSLPPPPKKLPPEPPKGAVWKYAGKGQGYWSY